MRVLPWILAVWAVTAAVLVGVVHVAYPNEREVERRVEVDPYRHFKQARIMEEAVNGEYVSRCVFSENRAGITDGTVPPQEGDRVIVVCGVHRIGAGPSG